MQEIKITGKEGASKIIRLNSSRSTTFNPSATFFPVRSVYVIVRVVRYLKRSASFAKRVYRRARGGSRAGGQGVYQFVATMLKSPAELERNSNEWERVALSICAATPKLSSAQVRTSAGRGLFPSTPRKKYSCKGRCCFTSKERRAFRRYNIFQTVIVDSIHLRISL